MDFDPLAVVNMHDVTAGREHRFQQSPLPLYGLGRGWTGIRSTGDYEHSEDGVRIGLGHGDPTDLTSPHVHVVSVVGDDDDLTWSVRSYIDEEDPDSLAVDRRLPERQIVIPVDGEPAQFALLRGTTGWAARATRGTHALIIEAKNIEPDQIKIVTITDLTAYHAGFQTILNREAEAT